MAPNGRPMYRKPADDPLVAKARETKGWTVRPAPTGAFVMLENSSDEARPYKARSEKWGELILMSESCADGCDDGRWDRESGTVECRRCMRIFDPDDDEQTCDGCGADVTGKPTWWPVARGESDFNICDTCAGFSPEVVPAASS